MANAHLPAKTPISFLQEQCARKGITPKYDLMSIEGAVHEPTFVYRVSVGEITATGTGQSKKKAKHAAAKAILELLISGQSQIPSAGANHEAVECVPTADNVPPASAIPMLSPYDDGIPGNPVGALQEVCMSRRWPPPTYDVADEEGQPHERLFTIACIVKKFIEKGSGKSKKLAKRQAAFKMLHGLKELQTETPTAATNEEEDEDNPNLVSGVNLRNPKLQPLNPSYSQKINQFYRNLKASPGESLKMLLSLSTLPNCYDSLKLLESIAKENGFEIVFVNIEERSRSGLCQCLVQLTMLPVAVCHGSGSTPEEARLDSAENALNYIKLMTR